MTPALYLVGATFFVIYIFIGDKRDALIGIGLVLLGLPAYAALQAAARGVTPPQMQPLMPAQKSTRVIGSALK